MKDKNFCSWEEAVVWLRGRSDRQELVKACFFDDPLEESAKRYYNSSEWKEIQGILSNSRRGNALDVGAGRGISSYALARDGWNVTALEPDASNIVGAGAIRKLAQSGNLDISVVENWGESLPFNSESFDLVHARQCLHHAKDLDQLCREIGRVLKPGGVFIATREHVISKQADLDIFLNSHPLHHMYGGENAFTLKQYTSSIKKSGISLTKVLGHFESDINLFPCTRTELKELVSGKLKIPLPDPLFQIILLILSLMNRRPGRLYSFIGRKE
jgi:SAM-dependent methyltransferase